MFVFPTPIIGRAGGAVFDTLNPLDKHANITLSNGNLTATGTAVGQGVKSIKSISAGKVYVECAVTAGGSTAGAGPAIVNASSLRDAPGTDPNGALYQMNGSVAMNGVASASYTNYSVGNKVMIAIDRSSGRVWFGLDGTWFGSPTSGTGQAATISGDLFLDIYPWSSTFTVNFGATPFTYTPPSGFSAWG